MKKALFLGDSNTWGYDPRGYFQRYDFTYIDYLNDLVPGWIFFEDAINGRLLRDVKEDTFDLDLIDLFCVMLGSNDLIHYYDVEQIHSFMHELVCYRNRCTLPYIFRGGTHPYLKIARLNHEVHLFVPQRKVTRM